MVPLLVLYEMCRDVDRICMCSKHMFICSFYNDLLLCDMFYLFQDDDTSLPIGKFPHTHFVVPNQWDLQLLLVLFFYWREDYIHDIAMLNRM